MKMIKIFIAFIAHGLGINKKDKFLEDVISVGGKLYSTGVPGLWSLKQETPVIVAGMLETMTHVADKTCVVYGNVEMIKLRRFIQNPRKTDEMIGVGVWVEASRCRIPLPEDVVNSGDIRTALVANGLTTS